MTIVTSRSRMVFRSRGASVVTACCFLLGTHSSFVCAEGTVADSLLSGVWSAQARYRLESVDDDGPRRSAAASTLRTHIGFETNPELALGAFLQIEDVRAVGAEKFDSTTNGNGQYSVIPDADATELNQAYLSLRGGSSNARAGRQALAFGNARFIGDVDFRQNQQTYDALLLQHSADNGSRLTYAYSWQVHRVFGEDHALGELDMRSHLLNYSLRRLGGDRVAAYAYLLEFEPATLPSAFASTQTYGASYDGTIDIGTHKVIYRAEYARQSGYADAPSMDSWYANAEFGWRLPNQWLGTVGVEVLSGDGAHAFQTPLATAHKFNGFADLFVAATPVEGLEDRYARLAAPWFGVRFAVAWHHFRAQRGQLQYGEELDAQVSWQATSHVLLGMKYADYKARQFAVDTRKAWLWVEVGF